MQNKFDVFEIMARKLTSSNYKECAERNRTRSSFADEVLDNTDPSLSLSASDKFRAQSFYPIIDRLITEMTKRREAYNILCERFNFLLGRSMTRDEVIHKAKELVNMYPSYLEDGFIEEFLLFSRMRIKNL
jgi:enolase